MATQIARRPERSTAPLERTISNMRSITVDAPPDDCYRAWRDVEKLPLFLSFVEAIRPDGDRRSRWIARDSNGDTIAWGVELIEDVPNERIVWRSIPDSDVVMTGIVRFEEAPADRGTVVRLGLDYVPRTNALQAFVGRLSHKIQPRRELHRFKQWFEAGEVATTEGQPSGRKGGRP